MAMTLRVDRPYGMRVMRKLRAALPVDVWRWCVTVADPRGPSIYFSFNYACDLRRARAFHVEALLED